MGTNINVTIEDDWSQQLRQIKKTKGLTIEFQIRQAVQDWIKKNQDEKN